VGVQDLKKNGHQVPHFKVLDKYDETARGKQKKQKKLTLHEVIDFCAGLEPEMFVNAFLNSIKKMPPEAAITVVQIFQEKQLEHLKETAGKSTSAMIADLYETRPEEFEEKTK
jgi:hypothetical protein